MLRGEMSHFMMNFSSYVMFEVLEGAWLGFAESLHSVADLDSLIQAHETYLARVLRHSFLEGPSSELVLQQLGSLLDSMLQFRHVHDRVCDAIGAEVSRLEGVMQRQRLDRASGSAAEGEGGSSSSSSSSARGEEGKAEGKAGDGGEMKARHLTSASDRSVRSGGWGSTVTESAADKLDRERFRVRLKPLVEHVDTLDGGFQALLKGFFRALNAQRSSGGAGIAGISQMAGAAGSSSGGPEGDGSETLAQARADQSHVDFLRFRLDFNEFYLEKYKAAALGKARVQNR